MLMHGHLTISKYGSGTDLEWAFGAQQRGCCSFGVGLAGPGVLGLGLGLGLALGLELALCLGLALGLAKRLAFKS